MMYLWKKKSSDSFETSGEMLSRVLELDVSLSWVEK